jgi:archaellum biogenesis ATPase FlaH
MKMNLLKHARNYCQFGWSVIPVQPQGKIPAINCWNEFSDKNPTVLQIEEWWLQNPGYNLGVVCGSASGIIVLDVDGDEGKNSIAKKTMPKTPKVQTGSDGLHLYFRYEEGIRNHTGLLPGVDIRSKGGQAVLPGSIHPNGERYRWLVKPTGVDLSDTEDILSADVAELPEWVKEALNARASNNASKDKVPQGERNSTLASMAGIMRHKGFCEGSIRVALLEENRDRCQPPLPDDEVEGIAKSIAMYEPGEPVSSDDSAINKESERRIVLRPLTANQIITQSLDVAYLVEPFIPFGTAMVLVGDAGVGKTWLTLDLAISVDQGLKWIGKFKCLKGKVLVIDEENSQSLLKDRLSKLLEGHQLPNDGLDTSIKFLSFQNANLSDDNYIDALEDFIANETPNLIIMDSLVRVHQANENDAGEMSKIFNRVKQLMNDYKLSIVFCHHRRKPSMAGNSASNMLRGSSEIRAFVDTHLDLNNYKQAANTIIVNHSKSRYSEPIEPFTIRIVDTENKAVAIEYVGQVESQKVDKLQDAIEFIRLFVNDGKEHTRQKLQKAGLEKGIKRDMLDKARAILVNDGELVESQEGREVHLQKAKKPSDVPLHIYETESDDEVTLSIN